METAGWDTNQWDISNISHQEHGYHTAVLTGNISSPLDGRPFHDKGNGSGDGDKFTRFHLRMIMQIWFFNQIALHLLEYLLNYFLIQCKFGHGIEQKL